MKITNRSAWRLLMFAGYGVVILSLLACAVLSGGAQVQEGSLQLEDGVVKVKMENGDWAPVAGKATFELTGKLESTDPWKVAGTTLETNETTQIEDGLQVGDVVHVRGTVLDDGTWVAYSIEKVAEGTEPTIILIGEVTSMDPWVVNGITLNVTSDTVIDAGIEIGMLVRVEIRLLDDGTWEVLHISLLATPPTTSGCVTIVATVVSVNGSEIQFLGWPTTVTLESGTQQNVNDNSNQNEENDGNDQGDDEEENNNTSEVTVNAGQVVLAVVCVSNDGTIIVVQIIVLNTDDHEGGNTSTEGERVLVCHKPGKKGGHTLSLPPEAVPAHLGHGDKLGACP